MMKNKQIVKRLGTEIENSTPEVRDAILRQCERHDASPQKGSMLEMANQPRQRPKTAWIRRLAVATAAVLVAGFGAWYGYGKFAVDAIIGIDVNPSIELKINRSESVLSATPLNADAETILDGMDLKNVDLDVAVNALIGSMLKNGYVSEIKNSVLISVENADSAKSAALQQRLSEEVGSLLEAYSVGGAVLTQTVSEDERLQSLAELYGISLGKAALVDLLVSQDTRLQYADIAALPINDINLLITGKQTDIQGISSQGQASSGEYIGEEEAKSIALADAGIEEFAATFIKAKLDFDDGRMVYEVDFYAGNNEYEYEIDALTGEIVSRDIDLEKSPSVPSTPSPSAPPAYIGEDEATLIAGVHAGIAEHSDILFIRTKLDRDDGRAVYDIEFVHENIEYDYEIDAVTGEILEFDMDIENYAITPSPTPVPTPASSVVPVNPSPVIPTPTPTPAPSVPPPFPSDIADIGEEQAKAIALAHAGLTEADVTRLSVKLERDDGHMTYEVEFRQGRIEYEYEIDAVTGDILEWDSDYDD